MEKNGGRVFWEGVEWDEAWQQWTPKKSGGTYVKWDEAWQQWVPTINEKKSLDT